MFNVWVKVQLLTGLEVSRGPCSAAEYARRLVARHQNGLWPLADAIRPAYAASVQKPSNSVISLRFSLFRRRFMLWIVD